MFIFQVAIGTKKHLKQHQLCPKVVPGFKELGLKNCYDNIVGQIPEVLDYLPDFDPELKHLIYPEYNFFWTLLYSLYHDNVETYVKQVDEERRK